MFLFVARLWTGYIIVYVQLACWEQLMVWCLCLQHLTVTGIDRCPLYEDTLASFCSGQGLKFSLWFIMKALVHFKSPDTISDSLSNEVLGVIIHACVHWSLFLKAQWKFHDLTIPVGNLLAFLRFFIIGMKFMVNKIEILL